MARTPKAPPKVSPQVWHLFAFVKAVREGKITATPDCSARYELLAVADMLSEILRGADPVEVFALGDRRAPSVPYAAYCRDQRLACAVIEEREATPNLETAIANIAVRARLAESTVRDAYHEHKAHARAWLELMQLTKVGTNSDRPD